MVRSRNAMTFAVVLVGMPWASSLAGQACYESSILSPTPFMGNNGELFRLADGSVWEVKFEYQYLYEYYPKVTICPARSVLIVRGKSLNVQRVASAPVQRGEATTQAPTLDRRPAASAYHDEFSFFDSRGRAVAYLDISQELVFYLWSGQPVAYLDNESVYGFNGKHLGWYQNGRVYDLAGAVVAAPADAFREPVSTAPPRAPQGLRPLKGLKELRPLKPMFRQTWSDTPASVFFLMGRS